MAGSTLATYAVACELGLTFNPSNVVEYFCLRPASIANHETHYLIPTVPHIANMVQLEEVRRCNSALVENHPLVAVFVGGTSGIGEQAIRALAAAHSDKGKGLRLYMVGRNAEVAKNIISDCTRDCPDGIFRFVQVTDIALLKNVDKACAEIKKTEEDENSGTARVDLLVMSQALLNFAPRTGTSLALSRYNHSRLTMFSREIRNTRRSGYRYVTPLLLTYALHRTAPPTPSRIFTSCSHNLDLRRWT